MIQETLDFSIPRTFQPSSSTSFPQTCIVKLTVRDFGGIDAESELRKFRTKSPSQTPRSPLTLITLYITPSYAAYIPNIAKGRTLKTQDVRLVSSFFSGFR